MARFHPAGDPAPAAIASVYPHLPAAPLIAEAFVPGEGWRPVGPDVYAVGSTLLWLRRYWRATAVAVRVGRHRVADFRLAELGA